MPTYLERYADIAKRLTAAAGTETLHSVSPELLYAIVLENDRTEFQLLGATRFWWIRVVVAAVAGNFSDALVQVPVAGATLAVVTDAWIDTGAANLNFAMGTIGTPQVTLPAQHRDVRASGIPQTKVFTRSNSVASLLPAAGSQGVLTPGLGIWHPNVVLAPGRTTALLFETLVVNTALTLNLMGYERPADTHEFDGTVV